MTPNDIATAVALIGSPVVVAVVKQRATDLERRMKTVEEVDPVTAQRMGDLERRLEKLEGKVEPLTTITTKLHTTLEHLSSEMEGLRKDLRGYLRDH